MMGCLWEGERNKMAPTKTPNKEIIIPNGRIKTATSLLGYMKREIPTCLGDPEIFGRYEHYLQTFNNNSENPLLKEIIESSYRSEYPKWMNIKEPRHTGDGFSNRFYRFYSDDSTENLGKEPNELIDLVEKLKFRDEPFSDADMTYEVVNENTEKYRPSLTDKELFKYVASGASFVLGGLFALLSYSTDYPVIAGGLGVVSVGGLANYLRYGYRDVIARVRIRKNFQKTNEILVKYSAIKDAVGELDEFLPFYQATISRARVETRERVISNEQDGTE